MVTPNRKSLKLLPVVLVSGAWALIGCEGQRAAGPSLKSGDEHATVTHDHPSEDTTQLDANLAKLDAADQPLAKAQGYCAVTSEPLGSMGKPLKLVLNDQPVFICCKGCERRARANPEKTLAKAAELKDKVAARQQP